MPLWTPPTTWYQGAQPAAEVFNKQLRDNLLAQRLGSWVGLVTAGFTYYNVQDAGSEGGIPQRSPQVRVSGDGREVQLRGVLRATAVLSQSAVIMKVPEALRPTWGKLMFAVSTNSSGSMAHLRLDVDVNGDVLQINTSIANTTLLTLDGIFWTVD